MSKRRYPWHEADFHGRPDGYVSHRKPWHTAEFFGNPDTAADVRSLSDEEREQLRELLGLPPDDDADLEMENGDE